MGRAAPDVSGHPLMANASGQAIAGTSGNFVRARALAASGGAGVIIPALLLGPYKNSSSAMAATFSLVPPCTHAADSPGSR